jgi:Transposase
MPRPYPPEFRVRALDVVRSGRSVPEVAKLLRIAESCLYRWKRQDLVDRGLEPGTSRAESAELVAAQAYQVTSDQWYPSGTQSSPLVYQGSVTVPDLCGGGTISLAHGGTFSATLG